MGFLTQEDSEKRLTLMPKPKTLFPKEEVPVGTIAPRTKEEKSQFMKGPLWQKIFDPLLAGQYAIAGLGRELLLPGKGGVVEGVKQRMSWINTFKEKYPYEATEDWKRNLIYEIGRVAPGLMADIILDPLWLIPPLKLARMFRIPTLVRKVAPIIEKSPKLTAIKDALGSGLIYRYGQPKKYVELAETRIMKQALAEERALHLAKPIMKRPAEEQKILLDYMRGVKGPKKISEELKALANPVIREYGEYEKRLVKLGALTEKDLTEYRKLTGYKRYGGATMYDEIRKAQQGKMPFFTQGTKVTRADLERLKKVKLTDPAIKDVLGEIKESGFVAAKTLRQLGNTVSMLEFFDAVGKNARFFSKTPKAGWIQLPNVKTLGAIKKGFVPPAIYKDLMYSIRTVSKWSYYGQTGMGIWKWFKVIANPATHFRNLGSNTILADLGGLPFWRIDYYSRALRDLLAGISGRPTKYYAELKANSNILTETFARRDVMDLINAFERAPGKNMFSKIFGMTKGIYKKGGNIYQAEEQWHKLALYMWKREHGVGIKAAAGEAEKWLFNYMKVPPFIDYLRGRRIDLASGPMLGILSGAYPFVTFSYKAIPRVAEIAIMKTPRLTKFMKGIRGIEELSPEQETERERLVLSEWMNKGMWMKVPLKDQYNRSYYLDLNFILPWGDIGEVGHTLMPSNPIYALLRDISTNTNTYLSVGAGRHIPIVKPGTPPELAYKQYCAYILRVILPNLMPFGYFEGELKGGYSFEKLTKAILEKPDYMNRTKGLFTEVLGTIFGLKMRPVDVAEETMWRQREKTKRLNEIRTQINSLMIRKDIDLETKVRLKKAYEDQILKLYGPSY